MSQSTVRRDIAQIRARFAAYAEDFQPLIEIFERIARYRTIGSRAYRAAIRTKDDGARARLLKESTRALDSEVQLLQSVGLLPRDLGTLRLQRLQPTDRIPSGLALQQLFDGVVIHPNEVESEAERAWLHGDGAASEAAALGVNESER